MPAPIERVALHEWIFFVHERGVELGLVEKHCELHETCVVVTADWQFWHLPGDTEVWQTGSTLQRGPAVSSQMRAAREAAVVAWSERAKEV